MGPSAVARHPMIAAAGRMPHMLILRSVQTSNSVRGSPVRNASSASPSSSRVLASSAKWFMSLEIRLSLHNLTIVESNQSSLGSFGMGFSRLINHFFYSRLNPGGILKRVPKSYRNKKIIWSSPSGVLHDRWPIKRLINKDSAYYKVSESILELVKEDNKMIDKKYNLNLEKYGYF